MRLPKVCVGVEWPGGGVMMKSWRGVLRRQRLELEVRTAESRTGPCSASVRVS